MWVVARARPFRVEVSGDSMTPGLKPGDRALATRVRRLRRGDVVVLTHPERPGFDLVKRVAAVPGDRIAPGVRLRPGRLYLTGDRAGGSADSRSFGPVRQEAVIGRVRFVYRRASIRRPRDMETR